MEKLLFLAHRIPYPPNKGDKIRSFNILRHLSSSYRIYLGAFIDDPADWRYVDELDSLCAETCFRKLDPKIAKLRSLRGLVDGQPLTKPYYYDSSMQDWVEDVLANSDISRVFVFSSAMAQYVSGPLADGIRRIIDFVDVDSDKWRQYSRNKRWPMNLIYRREADRLLEYDRAIAAEYDVSVFVSAAECKLFTRLAPEIRSRVVSVENGVDVDYFSPGHGFMNPYSAAERALVFVGAMDYWANADAVSWFARHVFPEIRQRFPDTRFYIVGSRPTETVRRLEKLSGVTVTGAVSDIRPYLAHATMSVATLRIARGIQNKVLEAMAMDIPVLATTAAVDGLDPAVAARLMVSDDARELAALAVNLLERTGMVTGLLRQQVCDRYSWAKNLQHMVQLIEGAMPDDIQRTDNQQADAGGCTGATAIQ